ncbi:MAG TPA: helix-turn-helix transcriptional regulator [Roseiflexaceae bacterium]|nr:helix-turn-helix transcriptional regulator [Roseiflexaceae bacterium]
MSNAEIAANPCCAYGFHRAFDALPGEWRAFPRHYLLYAASGAFRLELEGGRWLLPPDRAALIPAEVPLRVTIDAPVTCCSVLFDPARVAFPAEGCRVFALSPLAREMVRHAMRWGPDRDPADQAADRFFLALADHCAELAAAPDRFWLPRARSPELARALAFAQERLEQPLRLGDLARVAGLSERTLSRRFLDETGLTWGAFLQRARLIRAMELLAAPGAGVLPVADAAGFASASAFSSAFRRFTGETPGRYQRRVRGSSG